MNKVKCPVEGCKGFETYSGHPNPANHIKNLAKTELLTNFITDQGNTAAQPHANWLKAHGKLVAKFTFEIAGYKFNIEK